MDLALVGGHERDVGAEQEVEHVAVRPRPKLLDDVRGHRRNRRARSDERLRVRLEAPYDEELLDEPAEPLRLAIGRLEERELLFVIELTLQLQKRLDVSLHGRQRSPKLVRHDRDEVVLHAVQLRHLL